MSEEHISYSISADGAIFNCPAHIALGYENQEIVFGGTLKFQGDCSLDILENSGADLPEDINSLAKALFPDNFLNELSVLYRKGMIMLEAKDSHMCFKLACASGKMALLFGFQPDKSRMGNSHAGAMDFVMQALKTTADFFGIKEFIFYTQTGMSSLYTYMTQGIVQTKNLPDTLSRSSIITCAQIDFGGDSVFCKGVRMLFGVKCSELYLCVENKKTTGMITLPEIDTRIIKSKDLCIQFGVGSTMQFSIRGRFVFSFLPQAHFVVDCKVTESRFRIEAIMEEDNMLPIVGPFSLGETCLMIQAGSSMEFGLYSTLVMGSTNLFGAIMLKSAGSAICPTLISAATNQIRLSQLVEDLLGETIPGMDALDFINIQGLPFQNMKPFSSEVLKKNNLSAIVSRFNSEVHSEVFQLNEDEVRISTLDKGYDLADLSRMRHYYIDASGNLKLAVQFYYATENTHLGNYSVERGFFICGVIEIFKKQFEALFSFRESEGVLAYARIPAMNLGFLQIDSSKFKKKENSSLPVAKNSVVAQFVNPDKDGIVFFLSAGKKEVSFYLDGSVNVLGIFQADARIIYMNRMVSVDVCAQMWGVLNMSLHLLAKYADFSSGNFEFCIMLDTSGLKEKLTAVTKKIDGAISRLRNKMNDAKKEIDRAQNQVNELYRQISYYDWKIDECRRAISNAKWWKRAFVAIGKGIEIGAYEVAKIGIYAAIGVATAALQVAKGILNLSCEVGTAVMQAVNAVIQGALSLFYINYIKLEAEANQNQQSFTAQIDMIVLGKKYNFSKTIGKDALEKDAIGALSGAINAHIDSDLNHIEDGTFRSSWRKHQFKQYTVEENSKRLDMASEHLKSSVDLMKSMQATYAQEMHIPMEECDEMNVSMINALDHVENALATGAQVGNIAQLGNAMGGLKRSVAAQEKKGVFRHDELTETKKVIHQYDEARMLYNKVLSNVKAVQHHKSEIEKHNEKMKNQTNTGKVVVKDITRDEGAALLKVEEQLYDAFPVNRAGNDILNLSKEKAIRQAFIEAGEKLGVETGEYINTMRNRSRKGNYQNHI